MATKDEIAAHLGSLNNMNAAEYLDSLRKSVDSASGQSTSGRGATYEEEGRGYTYADYLSGAEPTEPSSALYAVYRAPRIGKNVVFMTSPSVVDTVFKIGKYTENRMDGSYSTGGGAYEFLPNISDRFRAASGMYWTDKVTQTETVPDSKNELCYMNQFETSNIFLSLPTRIHFNTLAPAQEDEFGRITEWLLIEANQRRFGAYSESAFDAAEFNKFLVKSFDDTKKDGVQSDYTTSITQLTSKSEIDEQYGSATLSYADVHGDYNYLDRRYESTIHNIAVKTNTLPNMYVFFAYQDSEEPNPSFKNLLSLNNRIDLTNHEDMFHLQKPNAQIRATPSEKYFSEWTRVYADAISNGAVFNLHRAYQNILLSAEDIATLSQYEAHKELFPMWMHVEFTTDKMTEFAQTLKDSQLMGLLQSKLCDAIKTNSLPVVKTFEAKTVPMNGVTAQNIASPEANPMMKQVYENNNRRVFDLTNWMNTFDSDNLSDATSVGMDTLYSTFLGTYNISDAVSNHPRYRFFKSLMAIILKGKVKKLLKKHMRSLQQVFEGKPAYHETVLYKVSKYDGPNTNGEPIQSFYIPNSNDIDVFTYIDTQVKYDTQYTYSITAYELVVGNKYQYQELVSKVQYTKWAAVQVINEPSLRLVEVPIYVHTNRVLDNPPIHPEVEFVPYKGINNKIKILVNSGVGRYDIPFEIIESEEMAQVNKHKRAQNKLHTDNTLMYETDDYPAFFEVRRMLEKPKSFGDFAGKKIKVASTTLKNTEMIASGMGIVDKIKPNTKYYYCIRAIDNHGHISYPSPIYEVEMVDDAGSIYPIVRICEFAPKFESQPALGGRRYIHIQPTMPQLLVNEENSGLVEVGSVKNLDKLNLSISEESVWGKKFKIRLTSKSTGRKIDFNVSFEHEHLKLKNRD